MMEELSSKLSLSDALGVLRQYRRALYVTSLVLVFDPTFYWHPVAPEYSVSLEINPIFFKPLLLVFSSLLLGLFVGITVVMSLHQV